MFCSNCGNKLNDDAKFCPSCGTKVAQPAQPQSAPQAEPVQTPPQAAPAYQTVSSPQPTQLGTKWLTVLPFLLGLGALVNVISLIRMLGSDSLEDLFFARMVGGINTLTFLGLVVLTVLAVVAIVQLVHRKKLGYQCVYALYGCQVVINLIVFFSLIGYSGINMVPTVIAILVGATMLGVNLVYFGKRKHLFS